MNSVSLADIREDYAVAAANAVPLCCTDAYDNVDLSWVPKEVLERNQGCSSPLTGSELEYRRGDTVVDLGCGAGLDAFLAARLVGPTGEVIGIDMTSEMLEVARRNVEPVTTALNHPRPTTRFLESAIEKLPLADESVDVVTSNCVVNLSRDKEAVLREILRVLRPGGRFVLADVFSPQDVPQYMQNDRALVSQCLGGAMEIVSFLNLARAAGFRGVRHTYSHGYRRLDGIDFQSLTMVGFKPSPAAAAGTHHATFIGPCSEVTDEDGTVFRRGTATPISAQVAAMLRTRPFRSYFSVSKDPKPLEEAVADGPRPKSGPCIYAGEFAILIGPFVSVRDDDGHEFLAGQATEICQKTAKVLEHPLYAPLFSIVNRAGNRTVDVRSVDCGPACC